MKWVIGVLFIVLIILISGCTRTGELTDMVEENLTPEEEFILEGFLNKTLEINETEQNDSPVSAYTGYTGPQNITQPLGCPGTCSDSDNCTYDYCSQDTGYECVHAVRICPNFVKICPDGVEVVCKNTCTDNSCTSCEPDCSEHQLPVCELTQDDCGLCQTPDTDNCECAQITSCVNNDNCCPEGCSYTSDNDCAEPEGECSGDLECDDANDCTTDRCEGIPKNCSHEEITECESDDGCCPSGCDYTNDNDCEEPEIFNITITYVNYTEEWVEIGNFGNSETDMTNWTINDTLTSPREVFRFPEFILQPGNYVYILKGYGNDNATHLYRNNNQNVWNNDADAAVLIDNTGQIISQYSYVAE